MDDFEEWLKALDELMKGDVNLLLAKLLWGVGETPQQAYEILSGVEND